MLGRRTPIDWPAEPARVERYGTEWLWVATKHFRVYFDAEQTELGRDVAERIDGLYEFLQRRAQAKPRTPINAYVTRTDEVQIRILRAWYPTLPLRSTSVQRRSGPDIALAPSANVAWRLGSAIHELTHIFEGQRREDRGITQPALTWWRGEFACAYHQRRLRVELPGGSFMNDLRTKLAGAQLRPWQQLASWARDRADPQRSRVYHTSSAVYYFIEETFGAEKAVAFWRGAVDAQEGDIAAVCQRVLGKPVSELEQACARFYGLQVPRRGLALHAERGAATRAVPVVRRREGPPAAVWQALLKPNEIDWPQQPELVEQFGMTWQRVQTKYCQLHFERMQSDAARELAGVADNVYVFYARLLETKPQAPIPVYLSPSKEAHRIVTGAWGLRDWRASVSIYNLDGTAAVVRFDGQSRGDRVRQLMKGLGRLFCRVRKGAPLPPWPEALAHLWWRSAAIGYCGHRTRDLAESVVTKDRIKSRFPAVGPARLRPTLDEMNARTRGKWGTSIFWGRALCHYIVERHGLAKLGEMTRLLTDVATEQPLPVAEVFAKSLGASLEQVESECAALFEVTLSTGRPRPTAEVLRPVRGPRVRLPGGATTRTHRPPTLSSLMGSLAAPGGQYTTDQWAYFHYAAGFRFDELGYREKAIHHYERALLWTEPDSKLRPVLEAALLARPTHFARVSSRTRGAMPWAVAGEPVDLREDEGRLPYLRGGTNAQFPFLLPDGHFGQVDAQERTRLADEHLQALAAAQGDRHWQAIEALGLLKERRALPLLHQIVLRKGATMGYRQCWVAARALYRIADPQSIPTLVRATRCLNRNVRAASSFALQRITGQHFRTPQEWERWWVGQPGNVRPAER